MAFCWKRQTILNAWGKKITMDIFENWDGEKDTSCTSAHWALCVVCLRVLHCPRCMLLPDLSPIKLLHTQFRNLRDCDTIPEYTLTKHFIRNAIVTDPCLHDCIGSILQVCQLHIHTANPPPPSFYIPTVFYWIQIWRLRKPFQCTLCSWNQLETTCSLWRAGHRAGSSH